MTATVDDYVAVLEGFLAAHIHEDPAHSNRTPIGVEFDWNGVAWCCETVCVALKRIGLPCMHTASVADAMARAQRGENGMKWIPKGGRIQRGDASCFDWVGRRNPQDMHISSIIDSGTQAKFQTIGGNENDAVTKQWRDQTYLMGVIRFPFKVATTPTPSPIPQEEIDEMQPFIAKMKEGDDYVVMGLHEVVPVTSADDFNNLKSLGYKDVTLTRDQLNKYLPPTPTGP